MLTLFDAIKRLKVTQSSHVHHTLQSVTPYMSKIFGIGDVNEITEAVSGCAGSETGTSARDI